MIKFNEIKYERINYDKTIMLVNNLLEQLVNCNDFSEYLELVKRINSIQNHIEEMYDYADIRNMRDSEDEYYKKEMDFWNSNKVKFDSLFLLFYTELSNSKFKDKLEKYLPSNFFKIIEYQSKTTSDSITDLIKAENDLKMQYRNLNKTKIMIDGEEKTISAITPIEDFREMIDNKNEDLVAKAIHRKIEK